MPPACARIAHECRVRGQAMEPSIAAPASEARSEPKASEGQMDLPKASEDQTDLPEASEGNELES